MEAPQGFLDLCSMFHQDMDLFYGDINDVVSDFVRSLSQNESDLVVKYLEFRLSNSDPQDLISEWSRCGADFSFSGRGLIEFYESLIEKIR